MSISLNDHESRIKKLESASGSGTSTLLSVESIAYTGPGNPNGDIISSYQQQIPKGVSRYFGFLFQTHRSPGGSLSQQCGFCPTALLNAGYEYSVTGQNGYACLITKNTETALTVKRYCAFKVWGVLANFKYYLKLVNKEVLGL